MAFLLMLCITGLPLIFKHEIDDVIAPHPEPPAILDSQHVSLDSIIASAKQRRPHEVVQFLYFIPDAPAVGIGSAPSLDAPAQQIHLQAFDIRSGLPIEGSLAGSDLMNFILQLHKDMFAGLPGMLLLGVMGVLLLASTVSGLVLYGPYMRKLDFGTIRRMRGVRLKWLDLHNFLGVTTAAWVFVVGLTGVINTLSTPIIALWKMDQLAEMTSAYKDAPPLGQLGSLDAALETAKRAIPEMVPLTVSFPGTMFTSQHHYAVFMQGKTPLTSRLLKPVLIDAETGDLTDTRDMPLYTTLFLLSQPLHFGDYGGLPLKILWAAFDIIAIFVLGSGLFLWLTRSRTQSETHLRKLKQVHSES